MKKYILLLVVSLIAGDSIGQLSEDAELFKTIMANDSILFEVGFNQCELEPMKKLLAEDLEFYHDIGGFQNKDAFVKTMEENICGNASQKPIRKLVKGSMKVFPLYHGSNLYAALQEGKHEFYSKEPNKEMDITGEALFSILWIMDQGQWTAKRIYSYDHHGVNSPNE